MNPQTDGLDELVEAALHTYPLADVPTSFSKNVMRRVRVTKPLAAGMRFAPRRALAGAALPGVMRKVLAHADVAPSAPASRRG